MRIDASLLLPALIAAAFIGVLAIALILRRQRQPASSPGEAPLAASSEGLKICPSCRGANLWTQDTCIYCGSHLADAPRGQG